MLHQATIIRGAQTASGNREYTFTAPEFDTSMSVDFVCVYQKG